MLQAITGNGNIQAPQSVHTTSRFPREWTWRERMGAVRARNLAEAALTPPEWEESDDYPHELMHTRPVARGPLDKITEQRMLRRPAPW